MLPTIRPILLKDAKAFYRLITTSTFPYLPMEVASIAAEERLIRGFQQEAKEGRGYHYAILLGKKVIGACGVRRDGHRSYLGEIGYFLDPAFWGRGVMSTVVPLVEDISFQQGIRRVEAIIHPKNTGSINVVKRNRYSKEGVRREYLCEDGIFKDMVVYYKLLFT